MEEKRKDGLSLIGVVAVIIIALVVIVAIVVNLNKNNNENANNVSENIVDVAKTEVEENVKILDDGTKINVSSKLKEDKDLDDFEITDIQLTYKNGITNLLATVKNNGNSKTEITNVEIKLIDKNGNKVHTVNGIIEGIEEGKTAKLNCSVTADFSNVYDFEINKK